VNLIGEVPPTDAVAAIPGAHLHLYGKSSRPGRKVGHVTVRADRAEELERSLERVQALVEQ
jgi:5-(carboxyamino)imidazole ribonucleotide synthase